MQMTVFTAKAISLSLRTVSTVVFVPGSDTDFYIIF